MAEGHGGGGATSLRRPEVYAARKLRRAMSLPEVLLWQRLRGSRTGLRVRRQPPIGPYVVDFFVPGHGLVIEVDGDSHNCGDRPLRDQARDLFLLAKGLRLVRIAAGDVLRDADAVVEQLVAAASAPLHHSPAASGPPPRAGEESS